MILESYAKVCWANPKLDALVLRAPDHDGSSIAIARQVYHRLLARLLSVRVYRFQWYALGAAFVLNAILGAVALRLGVHENVARLARQGDALAPFVGPILATVAFTLLVMLLPLAYVRWLLSVDDTSPEVVEARNTVRRVFLREVPAGEPAELRDVLRQSWITEDGVPASAEISATDASSMAARDRVLWWIPTALALAVPLATLCGSTRAGGLIVLAILVKLVFDTNPAKVRARELDEQRGVEGAAFVGAGGSAWAHIANFARKKQIEEGQKDETPFFPLGTSTGVLAARGDLHAPSTGLPFGMSLRDMQMHLLVVGGTGSGKTSCILRPVALAAGARPGIGICVLDGKGALPAELAGVPDMELIDPAHVAVSLVAGLSPVEVVNTVRDVLSKSEKGGGGASRFWTDSAANLLRHAAVIAFAAGGDHWTLSQIGRIATLDEVRREALADARESPLVAFRAKHPGVEIDDFRMEQIFLEHEAANPLLGEAIEFFEGEWANMEPQTRSNVLSFAKSWLGTILGHPDLLRWAQTRPDDPQVEIDRVLRGGRVALLVPAHRYGEAGGLVSALLKARLFAGLKKRAERPLGKGDAPVLMIIDEAQEVATADDATMLAIGRSLGLAVVAATQTVEGVIERLGQDVARKWLGIFGSVVAFPSRSPETDRFVVERAGQSFQPSVEEVDGMMVRSTIQLQAVSGAIAAARHQRSLRETIERAGPGLEGAFIEALAFGRRALGLSTARPPVSRLGLRPLFMPVELPNLLAEPNTALALVTRGRVGWRDVIRTNPVHPEKK